MGKTLNTALLVGGVGLAAWALWPRQNGNSPVGDLLSGDFNLPNINLPGISLPSNITLPDVDYSGLNPFAGWDWNPFNNGDSGSGGSEKPDMTDRNGAGNTETWLPIEPVQTGLSRTLGVYGRQIGGAALTGSRVVRPLPLYNQARAVNRVVIQPVVERMAAAGATRVAARPLTETVIHGVTGQPVVRLTERGLGKVTATATLKAGTKTVLRTGAKVGARAIPVVGWGLLLADVGADIARVFGVDAPEWLGFSGIVSGFTGSNPIEDWAAGGSNVVSAAETPTNPMQAADLYGGKPSDYFAQYPDWYEDYFGYPYGGQPN